MGHLKCCKCSRRIASNTKKIRRTSEPQMRDFIQALNIDLPEDDPICGACMQKIRRQMENRGQILNSEEPEDYSADEQNQENSNAEKSSENSPSHSNEDENNSTQNNSETTSTADESQSSVNKSQIKEETQYSDSNGDASINFESADLDLEENPLPKRTVPVIVQKVFLDNVLSVATSQAGCFICDSKEKKQNPLKRPIRNRVPQSAILSLWVEARVLVPKGNRCCLSHLDKGEFTKDAFMKIVMFARKGATVTGYQFQEWINNLADVIQSKDSLLDFDSAKLKDEDYKLFTGLDKSQFDHLLGYIRGHVYTTKNRSPRQALAVFLTQLRLGVSQIILGSLFGMPLSCINDVLGTVANVLTQKFVPDYLGFLHMSRLTAISKHMNNFVSTLYKIPEDRIMLIVDATYIYINKPQNQDDQIGTYSLAKKRNLVKPTMFVFPNGYILESIGLSKTNAKNNDASILLEDLKDQNGVSSVLQRGDHVVVDRGYRDAQTELRNRGYVVSIPKFLKKSQDQFTTKEANESRVVTMTRWVVEAAHGRVKNVFRFFNHQVHNSYMKNNKLKKMWRCACAIVNAFFPPLYVQSEKHDKILEEVDKRMHQNNSLKAEVSKRKWNKKSSTPEFDKVTAENFKDFPRMKEEDIFEITLGSYQQKNAVEYTRRQLQNDPEYSVMVHKEEKQLIRAKIQSRFHSKDHHQLWIKYNSELNGSQAISQYYCTCKAGARTVGTCSHVASVIWYLGFYRHTGNQVRTTGFSDILLDAARRRVETGQVPAEVISESQDDCPSAQVASLMSDLVNLVAEEVEQDDSELDLLPQEPAITKSSLRSNKSGIDLVTSGRRETNLPGTAKRVIRVPGDFSETFLKHAQKNTEDNVETCGLLVGSLCNDEFVVSGMVIPRQTGTSDSCTMLGETEVLRLQEKYSLITLGWVHTHPTQAAFLSSVDVHTQYGYQALLPEALAIVCAPMKNEVGVFSLSEAGMELVQQCPLRGFHTHAIQPFEEATHWMNDPEINAVVYDLR